MAIANRKLFLYLLVHSTANFYKTIIAFKNLYPIPKLKRLYINWSLSVFTSNPNCHCSLAVEA